MSRAVKSINEQNVKNFIRDAKLKKKTISKIVDGEMKTFRLWFKADWARAMNVDPAQMTKWTKGENIDSDTFYELADLLDVYPEYLEGKSDIMNASDAGAKALSALENEKARVSALKSYLRLSGILQECSPVPIKENNSIVGHYNPIKVNGTLLPNNKFIEYEKAIETAISAISEFYADVYKNNRIGNSGSII